MSSTASPLNGRKRLFPTQVPLPHSLQLRYAPEIVWALDDSITYGAKMLNLINSLGVKHDEDADEE